MPLKSRIVVGCAAVCAIVGACIVMYRTRPGANAAQRVETEERAAALLREGERAYATIEMLTPDDLSRPEVIRAALDRAYIQSPPPDGTGTLSDLLDHVADFAANYFSAESPEAYRAWRHAHGYEIMPLAHLDEVFLVGTTYVEVFGEPLPHDATSGSVFDHMWRHETGADVALGKVVRIADDPRGLIVCGGTRSRVQPGLTPFRGDAPSGGLPESLWNGAATVGVSPWYGTRGMGDRRIIMEDPSVAYTDVGLIVEHAGGYRVPIRIGCVWNPRLRLWSIEHLVYLNYPENAGAMTTKVF